MKRAKRLAQVADYPFARWAERVDAARQQGLDVIRMDIGNPDLPPPDAVIDALCQAANDPSHHGYAGYRGLPALRAAVADYYERRFGVTLDPACQVVPLLGSKEGIVNLSLACLDPGDLVLVPDPGYAPYAAGAVLAGASVYQMPLLAERGFLPDLQAIPATVARRATIMWLNYPNNPTAGTAGLEFLAEAVAFARRHDILLCHDAPYCDLAYNGYSPPSILQVPGAIETVVEFNSLSKTFNMAGWRAGMAVGSGGALALLAQVKSNIDSGIFLPMQKAAALALATPPTWIAQRNQIYKQRLDLVLSGLERLGVETPAVRASPYVWTRVPNSLTSEAFACTLLEETGVAFAPGSFFGPRGEGYVRISLTAPTERVQTAMSRLASWPAVAGAS
jgi:LL-diaminopimelate aminotransferase